MKKIRLIRPRDASPGLGPLINSPAPTTNGASPIASNGKSETPSRIKNSNTPARATAIGEAIRAIVVKPRGFGVAAPNALTRATKKSGTLVAGQPARTKTADSIEPWGEARVPSPTEIRLDGYGGARHAIGGRMPDFRAARFWRTSSSVRSNSLSAHASGAAVASVKFFAESIACPTGDIDEGSSSPRSSTDVSRSRKAGSAVARGGRAPATAGACGTTA